MQYSSSLECEDGIYITFLGVRVTSTTSSLGGIGEYLLFPPP